MKLFLITTRKLGDYYIVAKTPNDAQDVLTNILNKADYGFSNDRTIENIKIITNEVIIRFNSKPNFNDDNRLLLKEYWDKKEKDLKD